VRAIVGACAAAAAVALLYVFAAGTDAGLSADAGGLPGRGFPGTFRAVLVGAKDALVPVTGVAALALIVLLASRRSARVAIAAASIVGGALATTLLLEWILEAWDPFAAEGRRALGAGFFPSGHSAAAMALVLAAIVAVGGRLRLAAAVTGSIAVAMIGIGIVATHAHHPTDVAAGFLIAAGWAAAMTASAPAGPRDGPEGFASAFAFALLVPAAVVAGYAVEQPASEIPAGFIASSLGLAVMATAIVALVFRLGHPVPATAARRRAAPARAREAPRAADRPGSR
jgi:membrane-associated phospholipid phosphatase